MGWTSIFFFALCTLAGYSLGQPTSDCSAKYDCECDPRGINYVGNISQTRSGHTCKRWNAYHRYFLDETLNQNYCRNPGGVWFTAWCYTSGYGHKRRWGYCAVGIFDPACTNSAISGDKQEEILKELDLVLEGNDTSSVITNEVKQGKIKLIAEILKDLLLSHIDTQPIIIQREGIEILAQSFDGDEEQVTKEFGRGPAVDIPLASIISENVSTAISGVFAVLSGEVFNFTNASVAGREGFGELNSDIFITLISGLTTTPFKENVTLKLPLLKPPDDDYQPTCAFMIEREGRLTWSTDGCTRKDGGYDNDDNEDDDIIICSCNHLTNFAILMLTDDVNSANHNKRLSIITYIGTSISLVSLIIALIILFSVRILSTRIFLIKNQCIAIFIAQVLFISGVEHARNIKVLCGLVAGFTHFAFLSVFCWMFGQGIYILLQLGYQMLSKVRLGKWHYALFGWGIPAVIVGLTAAIKSGLYTNGSYCWLSTEQGGVWASIGPVIAILVVSISAFFCAMRSFSSVKAFKNKSEMNKLWSSLRAVTILAPTIGLTWLFGIFVNLHVSFQYIFAFLNSLQGFFLLVFQVAANEEIRTKLKLRVRRVMATDIVLTSDKPSAPAQPGCSHAEKDKHLPMKVFVTTTAITEIQSTTIGEVANFMP